MPGRNEQPAAERWALGCGGWRGCYYSRTGHRSGTPAPRGPQHGRYQHGQLAGAVTRSKNGRTFYTSLDALGQVETYVQSERAWAVKRAQQMGRYERVEQMRLVTKVTRGRAPQVFWVDRDGVEEIGRAHV